MIAYSKNLADEAEKLAKKETEPVRKQELIDIAKIHRWVPEHEARTFREGLTTLWICWTAIHLENPNLALSLGRLDQVLYELYRQDDSIDDQSAIELLCLLWLKIGDHVPMIPEAGEQLFGGAGSNQAITIGGVNKEGKDAVNALTDLILRSIELMGLRDPNLNARYFPGESKKAYLRRLCEANINTGATPALHNDRAVIPALVAKGDAEPEARDYGIVGCVEPTSSGRTYGSCGSILFNLTSVLELVLFQGRHRLIGLDKDPLNTETGDPATFNTFGKFKEAFEKQTRWLADKAVYLNDKLGKVHRDFYPTPILSAFFEQDGGPFGRGMDLTRGGAKINSSGVAVIGLADVADSLSAIQEIVYGKKDPEETRVAFGELLDALERDFEGNEPLRTRIREKAPKYGHDNSVADDNLNYILELLDVVFSQKTTYRGGKYRVGYWTLTNHAGLGKIMGATPNGRKKGANFASGVTPVSGFSSELTKALNSAAKLPAKFLSNGIALNLKFTPNNEDHNRMADNLVEYLVPYFDNGGMEIQFNIRSREDFLKAREEPDKYPELLVRVSGYTAYFKDLCRQMQDEIIERTEYRLSTGKEVDSPIPLPK